MRQEHADVGPRRAPAGDAVGGVGCGDRARPEHEVLEHQDGGSVQECIAVGPGAAERLHDRPRHRQPFPEQVEEVVTHVSREVEGDDGVAEPREIAQRVLSPEEC